MVFLALRDPLNGVLSWIKREIEHAPHVSTADWSRSEIEALLSRAQTLKNDPIQPLLKNKSVGLLFFNPSMRTRSSFQLGTQQMGGHVVVLAREKMPGPSSSTTAKSWTVTLKNTSLRWPRCFRVTATSLPYAPFRNFKTGEEDRQDKVIHAFAKYATVPVINMETITHPCQELAMALTLKEKWGHTDKKKFSSYLDLSPQTA